MQRMRASRYQAAACGYMVGVYYNADELKSQTNSNQIPENLAIDECSVDEAGQFNITCKILPHLYQVRMSNRFQGPTATNPGTRKVSSPTLPTNNRALSATLFHLSI